LVNGRPKLGGKAGVNFAKEGIWIHSIVDAVRAEPSALIARKRSMWFG
jgi:hypothetical protein